MGEILLIGADWQFRDLLRAQLLEEGYQVQALSSVDDALTSLIRTAGRPCLIILDLQALSVEAGMVKELRRLCGGAPLILCGGVLDRAALSQGQFPAARVLLRPFRVGDLVKEVRRAWAWSMGREPEE